ncbi:hypothetical protein O181_026658 [Austropuccinia psidii MF-1]|uniref:Tf2-1-like SH3-like domain-containing protein n=1 Tax=Austropuccinia psidii MF-1 TaxID=1389203 RepID=A0A9Q3CQ80_9BASI|nr:hypothetical protein [Austropuccinia psidii MF-1]
MIQNLEDMIRRFCAYGLEFKVSDGFTHDWCTLIPALELEYETPIHYSTGKTQVMLEKGWNTRLPCVTLKNNLVDIHPTEISFKMMLGKVIHHSNRCNILLRDLVLVSTLNFNEIKGTKKLEDSFEELFMIKALHGPNAAQLELTGEFMNKHPAFHVSLIKPYSSSYKNHFP